MEKSLRELLIRDLCARLPYHPFFKRKDDIMPLYNVNTYCGVIDCIPSIKIEDCRLYLRPMSSMTSEEYQYHSKLQKDLKLGGNIDLMLDFYLSHHLDFRGLIPMGLALEAHEDMYE